MNNNSKMSINEAQSACLRGDPSSLRSILASNKEMLNYPDLNGNTPLHMACMVNNLDCVKILVEEGAEVNATNKDAIHLDGTVETGGRTPLHCAATYRFNDIIKYLLHHKADANVEDLDSYTPFELYHSYPENELSDRSPDFQSQLTPSKDLVKSREHRKLVLAERKKQKKLLLKEYISSRYVPKYPEIFSDWKNDMFHEDFLHASNYVNSGNPTLEGLKEFLDEIAPRVYALNLFSMDHCRKLLEELSHYETTGLPQSRPNSMNNYGVILDDIGFDSAMQNLVVTYIKPISALLFRDYCGESLDSHHAFMVRYKVGEDLDLKTHMDDSEVTINVCLGKSFTGSTLYFKGFPGKPGKDNMTIEYTHQVGTALIHAGRHVHGVQKLESGERTNLVVWCRSSTFRNRTFNSKLVSQ